MINLIVLLTIYLLCGGDSVWATRNGYCGKCSPISGVKCIDETTFAFCNKYGVATNRIASCPSGLKCVNNINICTKVENGECITKCGKCENGRFTCVGVTAFSLCFGKNETSKVAAKCALGKVCSTAKFDQASPNPILDFCFDEVNLEPSEVDCFKYQAPIYVPPPNSPPLIAKPTPIGLLPGRPEMPTTEELPVEIPEEDPILYCNKKGVGKYQIFSDEKCQKYYFCYHNGYHIVGKILTCAEHSVFSPSTQKCIRSTLPRILRQKCEIYRPRNETGFKTPVISRRPLTSYIHSPSQTTFTDSLSFVVPAIPGDHISHPGALTQVYPVNKISSYTTDYFNRKPISSWIPESVVNPKPLGNRYRPIFDASPIGGQIESPKHPNYYPNPMSSVYQSSLTDSWDSVSQVGQDKINPINTMDSIGSLSQNFWNFY